MLLKYIKSNGLKTYRSVLNTNNSSSVTLCRGIDFHYTVLTHANDIMPIIKYTA